MAELPPDLEARLFDEFFAVDRNQRDGALRQLLAAFPPHASQLAAAWHSLARGADATDVELLPDAPPTIPGYAIGAVIGRGGFGVVHRAEQLEPLRRTVALKVLASGRDAGAVQRRFATERHLLARMSHPSIAHAYDAGVTADGRSWFAMEFVDGPPISRWLRAQRADVRTAVALCAEVCDAVQHAHQKGVIHRDLKPGNVLIASVDGRPLPKIIDFGVAKAIAGEVGHEPARTEIGTLVGTPEYMSPEQARGGDIDTRTDVYALGALLYHALTDAPPFEPDSLRGSSWRRTVELLEREEPTLPSRRVREHDPERARSLRGDLDWIVRRAMAKEPERRYASAAALAEDLRRYLTDRPVLARPPSFVVTLAKAWRRQRAALLAAGIVLLAIVAGSVASTVGWLEARRQGDRARTALTDLQRLSIPLLVRELTRQADDDLWPLEAATVPAMREWLGRARAQSAHARHQLAAHPPGAAEFGAAAAGLAAAMRGFDATIATVEDRIRTAEDLATRSRAHSDWPTVIAAIADSPLYGGLRLTPQEGLAPLGIDPRTGLAEFAHLASGDPLGFDAERRPRLTAATGITLVLIPGGPARIGSQSEDPAAPHFDPDSARNESPVTELELAPYFLSKFEVTQAQWQRLAGADPSRWSRAIAEVDAFEAGCRPVEQVSWFEADAVLRRYALALPTEPQWEAAARARRGGTFGETESAADVQRGSNLADASFGARSVRGAIFDGEVDDGAAITDAVVHGRANGYGLHGVFGNVSEWCRDAPYRYGARRLDDQGWPVDRDVTAVPTRVFRGGSYREVATAVRVARRSQAPPDARTDQIGLRPVRAVR